MSVILGSSRLIRRMVNSGVSMRRNRWCSGGSRPSRLPALLLATSSSDITGAPGTTNPGGRELEKYSWSDSTRLTSSCLVTRYTGTPNALTTRSTPAPRRISPSSGVGSKASRRMCTGGNEGADVVMTSTVPTRSPSRGRASPPRGRVPAAPTCSTSSSIRPASRSAMNVSRSAASISRRSRRNAAAGTLADLVVAAAQLLPRGVAAAVVPVRAGSWRRVRGRRCPGAARAMISSSRSAAACAALVWAAASARAS